MKEVHHANLIHWQYTGSAYVQRRRFFEELDRMNKRISVVSSEAYTDSFKFQKNRTGARPINF